ncbi:hypothetical protein DTL21_06065 [Bremerella cremea]|uniref:Uncharacterized protein n=1 Tax=Blastopirellula marina TaxID=124 RepID=A0A2S8FZ91_9BACT|nr:MULTISPECIES: hypothetical protein [Pirellulaceae]PQO37506.1 hypothetical protein C5Y83_06065 [Blastopirellula marina]RCS49893.1 hypothetical protein DTL21_06065 [Bremerella cremea]
MKGYTVPVRVWHVATGVLCDLAEDDATSVSNKLKAVQLLQSFIRDAWEIRIQLMEQEAAGLGSELPDPVVREDENFFGNNAHEKIKQQGFECN